MSLRLIRRLVALLLSVLFLAGCASVPESRVGVPPRDALDSFVLEGRFSLYQEAKSYSGRMSWTHTAARSEMLLSSPFGQGIAEIVTDERGARMTLSDGKTHAAQDAETLTRNVLGYPLPLALLADWVRGRAEAGEKHLDALGRLANLRHDGWRVDYSYGDSDPASPPVRIVAQRHGDFELRLLIEEWSRL